MKTKHFGIRDGQLVEVPAFNRGLYACEVQAATKGEALTLLLSQLERLATAPAPRVWVRNVGYVLAYANPSGGFTVDGGTIHPKRANIDGSAVPLVVSHCDRMLDAPVKGSLDYYGSEEFAREQAIAYTKG